MWPIAPSLSERDTHQIPALHQNRLIADSRGLGWSWAYMSLAAERPWSAELPPLQHDCLVYCVNGPVHIERRIDGMGETEQAVLRPRMFSLIPSGRRSAWSIGGRPEIILLYLHRQLRDQICTVHGREGELAPRLARFDPLLEQLCVALLGSLHEPRFASYANQLAQTAMLHLVTHHAATSDTQDGAQDEAAAVDGVHRAIEYLRACLAEPLTVQTLAQVAGMSTAGFVRVFRLRTGFTPYQYLLRERVARAQELLVATRATVSEIALQTGFSTPSHFANAFQRRVGMTPTSYRCAQ